MPLDYTIDWEAAAQPDNPLGRQLKAYKSAIEHRIEAARAEALQEATDHPLVPVTIDVMGIDPAWKPTQPNEQPHQIQLFVVIALSTGRKSTLAVIAAWEQNFRARAKVLEGMYAELGVQVKLEVA